MLLIGYIYFNPKAVFFLARFILSIHLIYLHWALLASYRHVALCLEQSLSPVIS